jgi:hypothetical protein
MPVEIRKVEAIFRYPVKSMRGERLEIANLVLSCINQSKGVWRAWMDNGLLPLKGRCFLVIHLNEAVNGIAQLAGGGETGTP